MAGIWGLLDVNFAGRWIGRLYALASKPPDLTRLDFRLWRHLKSVVYTTRSNIEELKENMRIHYAQIDTKILNNVHKSLLFRCQKCNKNENKSL